jgi:hypothetical protein
MEKRTRAQIQEIKKTILDLYLRSYTRKQIYSYCKNSLNLCDSSFNKYWTAVMHEEVSRIKAEENEIIVGFIERARFRQSNFHAKGEALETKADKLDDEKEHFKKTELLKLSKDYYHSAFQLEKDVIEKAQELGIVEKVADKVNMSVQGSLYSDIIEARKIRAKELGLCK